jgi:hypothetical protein
MLKDCRRYEIAHSSANLNCGNVFSSTLCAHGPIRAKISLVIGVVKSSCKPCRTQGSAFFVQKESAQPISTGQSAASLQTASAQRALKVDVKV